MTYEQIKDVPEFMFFSIISMMIDHYIKDHSLDNRETWKMLYEISGAVFEELGDYSDTDSVKKVLNSRYGKEVKE